MEAKDVIQAQLKKPTLMVHSQWFNTREEPEAMLPWLRLSWKQGHKGKNVDTPTPPDQQQTSHSARTAGLVVATFPPGEFCPVRYHSCLVLFQFVRNCTACCSRLVDLVPAASRTGLYRPARCLHADLRQYSSVVHRRVCCYHTAVLCTCENGISLVACKSGKTSACNFVQVSQC